MRIKRVFRNIAIGLTAAVLPTAGVVVTASPAQAFATQCKTLQLVGSGSLSITPRMTVPICYDGSRVWQNGNVTPGVSTLGWYVGGFDWAGTYNGGGNWLGAGENFMATAFGNQFSRYCTPRWTINSLGNVINYAKGC